jgi:hypothetical protein
MEVNTEKEKCISVSRMYEKIIILINVVNKSFQNIAKYKNLK